MPATTAWPVATLFDAWADAGVRKRWLKPGVKVRTANAPKTMRLDWGDGTIVVAGFTAKGENKSQVAIQVPKLKSKPEAERLKKQWTEYMDALGELPG